MSNAIASMFYIGLYSKKGKPLNSCNSGSEAVSVASILEALAERGYAAPAEGAVTDYASLAEHVAIVTKGGTISRDPDLLWSRLGCA